MTGSRSVILLATIGLCFAVSSAQAQHVIAGVPVYCADFRGIPVTLFPDATLPDVGRATLGPNGEPVMILNPAVMNRLPPTMQLFWYAHECAHHVLGHMANPGPANESMADCWAVRTGRDQGWFPPQAFEQLVYTLGNSPGSVWGHLPGPARIQNMASCYQSQ